jgi:hypothetical protein
MGRTGGRWEDNIKINDLEIGYEAEWIRLMADCGEHDVNNKCRGIS